MFHCVCHHERSLCASLRSHTSRRWEGGGGEGGGVDGEGGEGEGGEGGGRDRTEGEGGRRRENKRVGGRGEREEGKRCHHPYVVVSLFCTVITVTLATEMYEASCS